MNEDINGGDAAVDQAGVIVMSRFKEFLLDFRPKSLHSFRTDIVGVESNHYNASVAVGKNEPLTHAAVSAPAYHKAPSDSETVLPLS